MTSVFTSQMAKVDLGLDDRRNFLELPGIEFRQEREDRKERRLLKVWPHKKEKL